MRMWPTIVWTVTGFALSTLCTGCAATDPDIAPAIVAVPISNPPPADLLACPDDPPSYPTDAVATIPAAVRAAMIAHARAERLLRDRLLRLIEWDSPGHCADRP